MSASEPAAPIKSKFRSKQTELQNISQGYNSLGWQLKGIKGGLSGLRYRLPSQGLLILRPATLLAAPKSPSNIRSKLSSALADAVDHLDYCEYLLKQLSEAHRDAYKYTKEITSHDDNLDN